MILKYKHTRESRCCADHKSCFKKWKKLWFMGTLRYQFHPQISEGFHNCEMILDSQGAIKGQSAEKILTVFSIYTSLQAGRYHIKKMTHFPAAVWLELGLAWRSGGEFAVWASYSFVTIITSQISLAMYIFNSK